MSYIPIAPPPKPVPDPFNPKDNYTPLVPYQDVTHLDYAPLTNGEITRRVAFPRSLFRKPWEYLSKGSVRPCEAPPKLKSYSPLAGLMLGHGKAFDAVQNEDNGLWYRKQGIDPRAIVEIKDSIQLYGHCFPHPCEDAQCILSYREPDYFQLDKYHKRVLGYMYFRANYP